MCHLEYGKAHAFAAMNQLVPSIRSPSLTSSAEFYPPTTPVRALNLSGIPQTPISTPSSTPRPVSPVSTPATTPRGSTNGTGTTPPGSTLNTPRDTTVIPFDLETVNDRPPVPPSKSVWSTIFGFAFGPFASCVFPQCAPKYEEKNEPATTIITPNGKPAETMNGTTTPTDSKNASPNSSKNNSGRNSPVNNSITESGEFVSTTPPKNELPKQPNAEELEWILLDSLVGTGLIIPDLKTMFNTHLYPQFTYFYSYFILLILLSCCHLFI